METSELLGGAIIKLRLKNSPPPIPKPKTPQENASETPSNPAAPKGIPEYQSLSMPEKYHWNELLEVFDTRDLNNQELQEKVGFIFNTLKEQGDPKEKLIALLNTMGQLSLTEDKVEKIYHYLRLKNSANRLMNHYKFIKGEMKTLNKAGNNNE